MVEARPVDAWECALCGTTYPGPELADECCIEIVADDPRPHLRVIGE